MKKFKVTALVIACLMLSIVFSYAEEKPAFKMDFVNMYIDSPYMNANGEVKEVDPSRGTAPIIQDSRTLLPIRSVVESMGGTVEWNAEDKKISLNSGDKKIVLTIDQKSAQVGDTTLQMDVAPVIINDRTMIPIRFIAENFDWKIRWDAQVQMVTVKKNPSPVVTIEMENGKLIHLELYPEMAPNTVYNFISLINKKFYDGLIFHRVIPEFVIQGGDPTGTGTSGPGYSIKGEFYQNEYVFNTLAHTKGVLSMARSNDPDSAGSQFFIMAGDNPNLDGLYAAFGKTIDDESLKTVEEIVNVERDTADKPVKEQKIKKITVDTFGITYPDPTTIKE